MRDRSLAVIFTIVAVLLLGCPGLTIFCLGITGFIAYYSNGNSYNNFSPAWVNIFGSLGICVGIILVVITVIASYLLLRKKPEIPPVKPVEPLSPSGPENPLPPSPPDEPLPPSS
jgi:hypothetical protein